MKPLNFTFFALCALACWSARPARAADTVAPANAPSVAVARDPVTGQLRAATPAELRALAGPAWATRPAPGPVTLRSDGSRQVHLGEAGLVHAVLRRDGESVTMACTEHESQPQQGARHDR